MTNITANHYDQNGFETRDLIDAITDHLDMYLTPSQHQDVFNIVKYISRAGKKGDWRSDAYKAADYICHLMKGEYLHSLPISTGTCGECFNNDEAWCKNCSRNYADLFNNKVVPTYEQKAPELTCRMEPTTIGNRTFCEARVHEYECYSCEGLAVTYHDDEKPRFCPWCGAKVISGEDIDVPTNDEAVE